VIFPLSGSNQFELAVVAGLRAKQLIAGCVPRVAPGHKLTSTATLEVLAGLVAPCPDQAPAAVTVARLEIVRVP
jgi:DNA-directed RNA polymerase subunit K/omega